MTGDVSKRTYWKRSMKIAWPCILENVMVTVISFVDTIMVGVLGETATAAVAINSSPTWLVNSMSAGFAIGGTVLVAQQIGGNEYHQANETATQTLSASLLFSLIIMMFMITFSSRIPLWMGAQPEVASKAVGYLRIYSFSIMAHFCGLVASGLLRGAGNTKTPMLVSVFTNIVNIVGNFLLIYETRSIAFFKWTFKVWGAGLGVEGAAMATSFAQFLSGFILLILVFSKKQDIQVEFRGVFKPKWDVIKRVVRIGLPAAGERISISLGHVFFQKMIAGLGTVQIAAHYLATMAESITYMPANGFSVASTTLVGQALGGKNKEDAQIYAKINIILAVIVGIVCGIVLFIFPEQLLSLFTPSQDVIQKGAGALRTIALVEPIFCVTIVYIGILRGAGDTKVPLLASVVGMWGVRQIVTFVFIYVFTLDLVGAWLGMAVDIIVRMVILHYRYSKKKWLDMKIS